VRAEERRSGWALHGVHLPLDVALGLSYSVFASRTADTRIKYNRNSWTSLLLSREDERR